MTKPNPLRKAAILITALDTQSADQLLDQMPEAQAARIREAVFELDDIDPAEQQKILTEFLQSTGRSIKDIRPNQPSRPSAHSDDHGVELHLSTTAPPAAESAAPKPFPAEATATVDSYRQPYSPQPTPPRQRPFDFLREQHGGQLARLLQREHPQTIAVVIAHLPAERAAEMVGELPSALQAEVLRRVADLTTADPEAIAEIEQELRRSFQLAEAPEAQGTSGMTTVSSILAAAGSSRDALLQNIRQHDRHLSRRIGADPQPVSTRQSDRAEASWAESDYAASDSSYRTADLNSEIEEHRRLARTAQSAGVWQAADDDQPYAAAEASTPPPVGHTPAVPWSFRDLDALSDADLARVLQAAESELTMVALTGAEPAFVARLAGQLPPALARQFSHRIESVGPLKLRDIEAAQRKIADIAADLAEQGIIAQKQARPFAMAA